MTTMAVARLGLVLSLLATSTLEAQQGVEPRAKQSAIAGVVRDTTGRPLSNVTVFAEGRDASVVTDTSGRFHLQVPSGTHDFTIMRLGYRAVHFNAEIAPDTTVMLTVTLRAVPRELETVQVTGERMSAALLRDGFYDRRERGFGQYLDPEQVERLSGSVGQTSQMLRNMNGVRVRCPAVGACAVSVMNGCLTLFVDGVRQRNIALDERVSPGNVYAMEVYVRRALVPMEFVDPMSQCGAIVVWTRTRSQPRR